MASANQSTRREFSSDYKSVTIIDDSLFCAITKEDCLVIHSLGVGKLESDPEMKDIVQISSKSILNKKGEIWIINRSPPFSTEKIPLKRKVKRIDFNFICSKYLT